MLQPKIKCGDYEVLCAGSVIGYQGYPITIELEQPKLKFILNFVLDNLGITLTTRTINEQTIELTFHNCDSPLGIGNSMPLDIMQFPAYTLHFNYRIYTIEGLPSKLINYTFYKLNTQRALFPRSIPVRVQ